MAFHDFTGKDKYTGRKLSISEFSKATGIPASRLRAMDESGELKAEGRTHGGSQYGHRYYTAKQLEAYLKENIIRTTPEMELTLDTLMRYIPYDEEIIFAERLNSIDDQVDFTLHIHGRDDEQERRDYVKAHAESFVLQVRYNSRYEALQIDVKPH